MSGVVHRVRDSILHHFRKLEFVSVTKTLPLALSTYRHFCIPCLLQNYYTCGLTLVCNMNWFDWIISKTVVKNAVLA